MLHNNNWSSILLTVLITECNQNLYRAVWLFQSCQVSYYVAVGSDMNPNSVLAVSLVSTFNTKLSKILSPRQTLFHMSERPSSWVWEKLRVIYFINLWEINLKRWTDVTAETHSAQTFKVVFFLSFLSLLTFTTRFFQTQIQGDSDVLKGEFSSLHCCNRSSVWTLIVITKVYFLRNIVCLIKCTERVKYVLCY